MQISERTATWLNEIINRMASVMECDSIPPLPWIEHLSSYIVAGSDAIQPFDKKPKRPQASRQNLTYTVKIT